MLTFTQKKNLSNFLWNPLAPLCRPLGGPWTACWNSPKIWAILPSLPEHWSDLLMHCNQKNDKETEEWVRINFCSNLHIATNYIKELVLNPECFLRLVSSVLRLRALSFYFFEDRDKRKNSSDSCRFHWILIITRADFSSSLNVTSDLGQSLVFRWLINSSFCLLACWKWPSYVILIF